MSTHEVVAAELSTHQFWRLAGSAEAGSEHPTARAVVAAARLQLEPAGMTLLPVQAYEVHAGRGVACAIEVREWGRERERERECVCVYVWNLTGTSGCASGAGQPGHAGAGGGGAATGGGRARTGGRTARRHGRYV